MKTFSEFLLESDIDKSQELVNKLSKKLESLTDEQEIYNKSRESDIMKLNASGNIKYKGWYCKYK